MRRKRNDRTTTLASRPHATNENLNELINQVSFLVITGKQTKRKQPLQLQLYKSFSETGGSSRLLMCNSVAALIFLLKALLAGYTALRSGFGEQAAAASSTPSRAQL